MMRESCTYVGLMEETILEVRKILLRQGRIRFGRPTRNVHKVLRSIINLERLERMCDRLVTATTWDEVIETQ